MTFNELQNRSKNHALVIEFSAVWCEPCTWLAAILDELATLNTGKWELIKIDIDALPELSKNFNIRSVPTTIVFFNENELGRYQGMMWKKQFNEWINQHLNGAKLI